jgi:hypothetical protein
MSEQDPMHPKNIIPSEPKKDETYAEWAKRNYGEKYETWMPWIEDKYLAWFGKDNKASYVAKGKLRRKRIISRATSANLHNRHAGQVKDHGR